MRLLQPASPSSRGPQSKDVLQNMGKRDQIYSELPDTAQTVGKPDPEFIRRLFGARIVGALDSTLDDKFEILDGSGDEKYRDLAEILATLSDEQRAAVQTLLKDTGKDFLYWMLVKIRNFAYPVDISFLNPESDESDKICSLEDDIEIHHQYFDWIEEFSDHIDEG